MQGGRLIFLGFVCLGALVAPTSATAAVPAGFTDTSVGFTGLANPTVVRFAPAPDNRIFVAEKSGLIKTFDSLADTTPTTFADLRTRTYNFWDRGLLGMALDPNFASNGFVYVMYAHDADIGGTAPKWGTANTDADPCPTPPGPNADGCVISGRISRLTSAGAETVLVEDYCQQYPSHSVGALEFDSAGNLWASGGDGASFTFADFGQDGNPVNPCADPLNEGGALRSQDLRTHPIGGDSVSLDGTLIRINPSTGAGVASNPLAGDSNANARRVVAYGVRNPFRFTISPDNEIYTGDVGWSTWEEINRFPVGTGTLQNFGWPCYEGNNSGTSANQPSYDALNLSICETLYGAPAGTVQAPLFAYNHGSALGTNCESGTSSIAGLAFNTANSFPVGYDGALFFADYSRDCIWTMTTGADGKPDPTTVTPFQDAASNPVNLTFGPGGALFYPDFDNGQVRRIAHTGTPAAPYVTSQGGVVTYHGSNGANSVVVTEPGTTYRFDETGISADGSACTDGGAFVTCPKAGPTSVVMNMGGGNDPATASGVTEDPFTIRGQSGNDTLTATGADDTLNGGAGNDRLDGAGNTAAGDELSGGADIDRVLFGSCGTGVTVTIATSAASADNDGCTDGSGDLPNDDVYQDVESFTGTAFGDTITGNCTANTFAGSVDTTPAGTDGDDTFNGDPAGCLAATSDGTEADFMGGGEGADIFNGDGSGGNAGFDTVTYGAPYTGHAVSGGTCLVTVNRAVEVTLNETGDDCDGFGATTENVNGDVNRLIGSGLADSLSGSGADQDVQLFGRLGDDLLTDGPFNDLLNGEGGTDTANCSAGANVSVNNELGAGC